MRLRERRGVSTVLGTLIFVGILFTAVIPMALVMKQADNVYIQKVHEAEIRDEERESEDLTVYTQAVNSTNQIKAKVENKGNVPVKIVRVWTNDQNHSQNEVIKVGSNKLLGPFNVSVQNGTTVNVKVATERGNTFTSLNSDLYYSDGMWYSASLGIVVNIVNAENQVYRIFLINKTEYPPDDPKQVYITQGVMEKDESVWATIIVDGNGLYELDIERKVSHVVWKDLPATPVTVELDWPNTPPVLLVVVSSGK